MQLFINNEFVNAKSGKTFVTTNPATGEKICDVAEADTVDVELAVAAAEAAFAPNSEWRKMDASARGKLLNKLADLIQRDVKVLAKLESLDNGKTVGDSEFDIGCAIDTFRYYAGYADKTHGNTIPADGNNFLTYTKKQPVGVVGQIIPWNYPILMLAWKWGPALATGCTSVLKPAEQTPLTALHVASLAKEAGFPAGVVNVVPGYGPTAGAAISSHPRIRKVAFTGSVEVGKLIMAAAAQSNLKRVSLELGGKSPLIICEDADLDEAATIAHNAIFANHGQNCCAGSRTFVHEKIYDAFVKKAVKLAESKVLGSPFDEKTTQGPQVDQDMFDKVLGYVEAGKKEGAKCETGGKRWGTKGFFVEPTVFSNVTDQMKIAREEIFGPVQSILKFSSFDEVIERANNTEFGLAAGIVTKDLNTALKFTEAIEAGSVW